MSAETKEIVDAFAASVKEIRDDAEWRGRVTATMEMMVKSQDQTRVVLCGLEEKLEKRMATFNDAVTRLRVKVAGWSALYGSIGAAVMYLLMQAIAKSK